MGLIGGGDSGRRDKEDTVGYGGQITFGRKNGGMGLLSGWKVAGRTTGGCR